jgi:hypothetical protein
MSTPEDNSKEISEDAAPAVAEPSPPEEMAEASSPEIETEVKIDAKKEEDHSAGAITLFFFLGLVASLIVGWVIFPKLLYSRKTQPIDFNHVLHVETVDEGCESCHFFREDGSFAGIPKLEQCIECHEEVQGESPDEIKFVEEYVAKEREVPWLIYSKQPDCVFFSHVAHVKMAKMDCTSCHGPIGESEHLKVYEENRITGYSRDIWGRNISGLKRNPWDRMKMDDCAECHENQPSKRATLTTLPWPINWMPRPWETSGGKNKSVQTQKDACFVCHK